MLAVRTAEIRDRKVSEGAFMAEVVRPWHALHDGPAPVAAWADFWRGRPTTYWLGALLQRPHEHQCWPLYGPIWLEGAGANIDTQWPLSALLCGILMQTLLHVAAHADDADGAAAGKALDTAQHLETLTLLWAAGIGPLRDFVLGRGSAHVYAAQVEAVRAATTRRQAPAAERGLAMIEKFLAMFPMLTRGAAAADPDKGERGPGDLSPIIKVLDLAKDMDTVKQVDLTPPGTVDAAALPAEKRARLVPLEERPYGKAALASSAGRGGAGGVGGDGTCAIL